MMYLQRCLSNLKSPKFLFSPLQNAKNSFENFSNSSESLVAVSEDENKKTAIIKMQRPPVNSLNMELLMQLTSSIKELEKKKFKGFILTSSSPTVFSSGLDIMEMYKPKEDRLRAFWKALQETWKTLYATPLISMAAINGHAPAGGCMLALSCDYRVMIKSKVTIGMNETLLGIAPPQWFSTLFINTVGFRAAEKSLNLGQMYTPDEALKMGLVDDLAADPDELQTKIQQQMTLWQKIPDVGRQTTKLQLRKPFVKHLQSYESQEIEEIVKFCSSEPVQKSLGRYIEQLKSKKS